MFTDDVCVSLCSPSISWYSEPIFIFPVAYRENTMLVDPCGYQLLDEAYGWGRAWAGEGRM